MDAGYGINDAMPAGFPSRACVVFGRQSMDIPLPAPGADTCIPQGALRQRMNREVLLHASHAPHSLL
jgi:hypothetical protein